MSDPSYAPTPPGTVLVTGAARRVGRAIALELACHGWAVAVHCATSVREADEVVATIRDRRGVAEAFATDLADEPATRQLMTRVAAGLGPVRALVNNASVFEKDDPTTTDRRLWDIHFAVNLRAPLVLAQELAARLPAGAQGNVVNIIDQRVLNPTPYFTSYTLSKAGLWTLTRTLALAWAPRIRVNAVGPGPTLPSVRQSEAQFVRQWATLPLRRPTDPEEIARAVRYILDLSSMTGQMIALDGGQHLGWVHPHAIRPVDE